MRIVQTGQIDFDARQINIQERAQLTSVYVFYNVTCSL